MSMPEDVLRLVFSGYLDPASATHGRWPCSATRQQRRCLEPGAQRRFGTKCVVTGDVSQIDLPGGVRSGLVDAAQVLDDVQGIAFTRFTSADVVRHPLVARIVEAYDAAQGGSLSEGSIRTARHDSGSSARGGASRGRTRAALGQEI